MPQDSRERRTIIALATPSGKSALAMIRISGPQSISITAMLVNDGHRLTHANSHTFHHTTIVDPSQHTPVDTVVALVYRAPHSYSGEDTVELCCHGNQIIVEEIIDLYQRHGAEPAEAGEFTLQAMTNGKLDLTQAEAVQEVIDAEGHRAREVALFHLNGGVRNEIEEVKQQLVNVAAGLNIQLDYPAEESGEITIDREAIVNSYTILRRLIATYRVGRFLRDGISVVLLGKVNGGKSSLFNYLLRENRAIVSDHAGTTRDYLEVRTEIDGLLVRLFDTAGLRETDHEIEQEGITRTRQLIKEGDILLYVIDSHVDMTKEEWQEIDRLLTGSNAKSIMVYNKSDLIPDDLTNTPPTHSLSTAHASTVPLVRVSAKTGAGMTELTDTPVSFRFNFRTAGWRRCREGGGDYLLETADVIVNSRRRSANTR